MSSPNAAARLRASGGWQAALLYAGFAACAIGFYAHDMGALLVRARIRETALLALVAWLVAWPLARLARCRWATAIAAVWFIALIFFTGPSMVLATALLATAGMALGDLLLPGGLPARPAMAAAVGLAMIGAIFGWLLPLPIHHWYVYLPLLAALAAWRWRALWALSVDASRGWCQAVAAAPAAAAFAVIVLGLGASACWLPTMQGDDVSYHLALPAQLLADGEYRLDPTHQVWALAPWLGDTLHGVVQVLARGEARGALNGLWVLVASGALWACSAGLGMEGRNRWWTLALFASLPTLPVLTGGMQTELPATALLLALAALIVIRAPRASWAGAVLCGALFALKLTHATAVLPLVALALWQSRSSITWRPLLLAAVLAAAIGGSSYAYAAWISGNPVLPLFNAIFHSPYFAQAWLDDPRWHAGFGPALPWLISFDSGRYLESGNGSFGFVLVALAGAWLLALWNRRTRAYALAASLALALALLPLQYARYAFPGMVLLLPALVVATVRFVPSRVSAGLLMSLCVLNLAFHTSGNWVLHSGGVRKIVRSLDDEASLLRVYLPERLLLARLRSIDPRGIVLATDPDRPFAAEAGRLGRSVNWYDPKLESARLAADGDASGELWQALFARSGARWLLVSTPRNNAALRKALAGAAATRVAVEGGSELWQLPATGSPP